MTSPQTTIDRAPTLLVFLLAGLTSLGPFSIDTYLPSFHAIGTSLAVDMLAVQQTLTAFMLPFTVMTLWHGALSDALGRKRVILVFLALFVVASFAAAAAVRIEQLWLARACQGLTAGAGMIIGRAIVRDLHGGAAAQRLMAHVTMLFAIAPAIAPIIGGWLETAFGWRSVFIFLGVLAALIWLATALRLPETLPPEQRQSLHPIYLWRAYRSILGHRRFIRLTLGIGLGFAGFFIYVLAAPVFLMRHLGLHETGFAWMFVPTVSGMILGSWLSGRVAGKWSPRRTVLRGYLIMGLAAAANLAICLTLPASLFWNVLPLVFYTFGNALVMPNLTLMGLELFPSQRGMASSCQSFLQSGLSTLGAGLLVPVLWDSPATMAAGQCVLFAVAAGIVFTALRPNPAVASSTP